MGDIKMEPIKHYSFDIRFSQMEINDASSACKITAKIAAQVVDIAEEAIVEACVTAAREAGIHELYLLDRKFVIDALIEKITNAVDAEPVRHGKWYKPTGMMPPEHHGRHRCDRCKSLAPCNPYGREN